MYDFDKILLKPNIEPLDTNNQRIRRNLMVASIIVFFVSIASDGIDTTNTSIAGIKFNNLQTDYLYLLLLLTLGYFLFHFIWACFDHLKENRLRLTGVALKLQSVAGTFGSQNDLYANVDDARQSSIYSWWWKNKKATDHFSSIFEEAKKNIESGKSENAINSISTHLDSIAHRTAYIEESLKRFDGGFWKYQRSQLLRWFLFDFGIPCFMGAGSLALVFVKQGIPLISTILATSA